jgi:hypothetical protein
MAMADAWWRWPQPGFLGGSRREGLGITVSYWHSLHRRLNAEHQGPSVGRAQWYAGFRRALPA